MEEEFKKTESKVARINYNIHNEVVDELEETRNLESAGECALRRAQKRQQRQATNEP